MNSKNPYLTAENIGKKLKEYRKKKKMTLQNVADIVHRSTSAVSAWERGERNVDPDTFVNLCILYEVESFGVFYGEPEPTDGLTMNERRLIEVWRSLNEAEQDAFMTVLNALHKKII